MPFITDQFLLRNRTARRLYAEYAAGQPILDYHCHLSARDIAEDRRFRNLFEIWLEGDHYKWRAMRANGVAERFCTGEASDYEKFLAWAQTVPFTLRNPLYHWSHLELLRYFGIEQLLDPTSAREIWTRANRRLAEEYLSAQGILRKFQVKVVCTTDDPTDSLEHHRRAAGQKLQTQVFPTFRPDRAFQIADVSRFNVWIDKLAAAADVEISTLSDLLNALRKRHDVFHEHGCRASDHGLECCHSSFCSEAAAARIFSKARCGSAVSPEEAEQYASFLLLYTAQLDAEKGWVKQLHLGALRNVNPAMLRRLGADCGYDSIGDWRQIPPLAAFLARLSEESALPKIILYNLNPADNYPFATMAGNFQDGSTPGKIQYGAAWWFLDNKNGMEAQLNALSDAGLLARFVGMVTDSRSFMSYPRHEYFRRILCNLLGREMECGELPQDEKLVGKLIEAICYSNARDYFAFPVNTAVCREKLSGSSTVA
ncbi:MAG TPA: glucuronate isomerase [Terriglobales bacterium]|nr:glucuronate isomerase [Terriglobales bacterium]